MDNIQDNGSYDYVMYIILCRLEFLNFEACHELFFLSSSNKPFICNIPQTGQYIPDYLTSYGA